jgi:hypothetical protein
MVALAVQRDDPADEPILELDPEAAADTAAPAAIDTAVVADPKISLGEMWSWLSVRIEHDEIAHVHWSGRGHVSAERQRQISVQKAIANAIAFLIDNENDIRNYMKSKRESQRRAADIRRLHR